MPADARLQQHVASRSEITGLLHDGEALDLDLLGRAMDVEVDGGELARRTDGEVAVGGELGRGAVDLDFTVGVEELADPFPG